MKEILQREYESLLAQQKQAESQLIAINGAVAFAKHLMDNLEKQSATQEIIQP